MLFRNPSSITGELPMKLDRIIQSLLPHDEKFFVLFDQLAQTAVEVADVLRTLPSSADNERRATIDKINEIEHTGDNITHQIFTELNSNFVTPFDREDIHKLASSLDDVIDYAHGSANRFFLYKIKKNSPDIQKLTDIIYQSAIEIQRGIAMLSDPRRSEDLNRILQKINQYENEADDIFNLAIAELFDKEDDAKELVKIKEVLVSLETGTDKCEDVANVLEAIMIKNA
jgi:predicted phosphate transport protein (TIGR00153 family)